MVFVFVTANSLTWHSRKSTGFTNIIRDGFVLFKCPSKPWQWASKANTRTLKLKQLNWIQPSFIYYLHLCFSYSDKPKCLKMAVFLMYVVFVELVFCTVSCVFVVEFYFFYFEGPSRDGHCKLALAINVVCGIGLCYILVPIQINQIKITKK